MERGGGEEEAGSPAGEHSKPHELLEQNMDSKDTLSVCAGCLCTTGPPLVFYSYSIQIPNTYSLFYKVMLLHFIVLWFPD